MLLFKRDDITYVSIPIIEPRLHCVRVKIYIHYFLKIKNKKHKRLSQRTESFLCYWVLRRIFLNCSEDLFDTHSVAAMYFV